MHLNLGRVRFLRLAMLLVVVGYAYGQGKEPFRNPQLSEDARITDFIGRLTLEEKIDLFGATLNVPRLAVHMSGEVPTILGSNGQVEAIHGLALSGGWGGWAGKSPGTEANGGKKPIPTTQFPQALGLGATWDPDLVQRIGNEIGSETRYVFEHKDRGGLIVRAPNADLARDPRWGRIEESFGEDPYLTGKLATAVTQGLQGAGAKPWQSISMLKHFMANSNEDYRDGSSSNFDERLLREYYTAPFRMAIQNGGADAVMVSYNAVNGIPMTSNTPVGKPLLESWGFNGLIATDRAAVMNMVNFHRYYPDITHAVAGAIHGGVNQFLDQYLDPIHDALKQKLITEADLDANLRGLIRVLLRAGAFGDSSKSAAGVNQARAPWDSDSARQLALQATRESIVLLKNDGKAPLLPLDMHSIKSIAVLGHSADAVYRDGYGGDPPFAITPLQGIKNKAGGKVQVRYSKDPAEALRNAKTSDVAIVFVGDHAICASKFGWCLDPSEGMEGIDRKVIDLSYEQEQLIESTYAANPRTIVVLVTSFPYSIKWAQDHVPSILEMSHSSEMQGMALADVLFGDYSPSGRLTVTWPESITQLPAMMDYDLRRGRTYMYFRKGKPLYAFGHGLSYTEFRYSDLNVTSNTLSAKTPVTVEATITNVGKRSGDEVAQLYIQHLDSKIERAQKELKGFQRVSLEPGASTKVTFALAAKDVAYWDTASQAWKVESDKIKLMLGSASNHIEEQQEIDVVP